MYQDAATPPPVRSNRPWLLALLAVAVLGLVAVLVVAALQPGRTVSGIALPADQYGPQDTATKPPSTTTTTTTTTAPKSVTPALTPGWQTAYSITRNATYDVPPDWTVPTPTTIVGFESGSKQVVMSGAATYQEKACGKYHPHAISGVTGSTLADVSAAAKATADNWSKVAAADDDRPDAQISLSPVETLTVQGKPAAHVTATLTNPAPYDCEHPTTSVLHVLAVPGNNGQSVVMVIQADQGIAGALTDTTIRGMLTTLRPAGLKATDCKQDRDVVGTWCG